MKAELITLTAAFMLCLTGCERDDGQISSDGVVRSISLILGIPSTKSDVTETEATINKARVYVFNRNGELALVKDSKNSVFNIYLTDGTYSFYTFVNCPSIPENPTAIDDVYALITDLKDNTGNNLLMTGSIIGQEINGNASLGLSVKRLVSKFTFNITNSLKSPELAAQKFQIENLYITNVAGETNLALTYHPDAKGVWYNKMGFSNGPADALTSRINLCQEVPYNSTVTPEVSFYAYPNPWSDPQDRSQWSVRCTRAVLVARIGGTRHYYPVTVSPVEPNRHYIVSINVTGPGVNGPEEIPQTQNFAQMNIVMDPWDEGGTIAREF